MEEGGGGLLAALQAKKLKHVAPPKEQESALKEVDESSYDPAKLKSVQLNPIRWNKESQEWESFDHSTNGDTPMLPKELRLLTFNIWIQQLNMEKRMGALATILDTQRVDMVTLQEATPLHLQVLKEQPFVRENFFITPLDGQGSNYRTLILSKYPMVRLRLLDMPYSPRKMLLADIVFVDKSGNKQTLQVATVHLKSEAMATRQRKEQLEYLYTHLDTSDPAVVSHLIAGDFNLQFSKEQQTFLEAGFIDVWKSLHPKDKGETFDATTNVHAATTAGPGFKQRLDFVTLRSGQWQAKKIRMVGKEPIEERLWISDHWGLLATFKPKKKK